MRDKNVKGALISLGCGSHLEMPLVKTSRMDANIPQGTSEPQTRWLIVLLLDGARQTVLYVFIVHPRVLYVMRARKLQLYCSPGARACPVASDQLYVTGKLAGPEPTYWNL